MATKVDVLIPPGAPGARRMPVSDGMLFLTDLMGNWRQYVAIALGLGLLAYASSFLVTPLYTSRAAFMPEQPRQSSAGAGGLLGMASQLGLGLNPGGTSPQLYAELTHSVSITDTVLLTPVRVGSESRTLADFLTRGATPNTAIWEKARAKLIDNSNAGVNPRTNVIELQVRMPDPAIAQIAARRYMDAIGMFNRSMRQTSAKARREFLGKRLSEAQDSLRQAENGMAEFLAGNRTYQTSPSLGFVHDRLQRRVTGFQELLTTLRTEHDAARLDEVNDQPLLTAIDAPSFPTRAVWPRRLWFAALGVGAGFLIVLILSLGRVTFIRMLLNDPAQFARVSDAVGHVPGVRQLMRSAERNVAVAG